MLLKIIDMPAAADGDDCILIDYQGAELNKTYQTDLYTSPFSSNFRKTLTWYFNQYPGQYDLDGDFKDDKGTVQKVIRGGQGIGDELMGDDYELIQIVEDINSAGFGQLEVQLCSKRPEFFAELWETLVLPDTKYMLATAAHSFVRRIGDDNQASFEPLNYDLKVAPVTSDQVAQMLQGGVDNSAQADKADDKPLNVLTWVARAQSISESFDTSTVLERAIDAKQNCIAVNYLLQQACGLGTLQRSLGDKNQPVHIFHYDGPILIDGNNEIRFIVDGHSESTITASKLASLLVEHNVGLLSIDARRYLKYTPKTALAMIADTAKKAGLGNVLGLSHLTDPWVSAACFDKVYRHIATGLELSQAVVEARKNMQRTTESERLTPEPLDFHDWSLPIHYSWQKVQFFANGLALEQQADPNYLTEINKRLFGFQSMLLPPLLSHSSDGQVLNALEHLTQNKGVVLSGVQGGGKSWHLHAISLYLAQQQQLDFALYFDFGKESYSVEVMLEMLANLLSVPQQQKQQVLEVLQDKRCLFVFDELSDGQLSTELVEFIARLRHDGHLLLIAKDAEDKLAALDLESLEIASMSLMELKKLTAPRLRQLKAQEVDLNRWHEVLEASHGNPWLAQKLMAQLVKQESETLVADINRYINTKTAVVERFYQWQWQTLSSSAQTILVLCADVRGLLLEMVASAADQQNPPPAAQHLFAALGENNIKFNDWIEQIDISGFVNTYPHGRLVDVRALSFIKAQPLAIADEVKLYFSQLICEGVRMLSSHVLKQPNHNITNNLLFNRRSWVEHFERLWQGKDFRGFFGVKQAFDDLLRQAQLHKDSELWTLDLLSRHPLQQGHDDEDTLDRQVAWLSLAGSVAGLKENDEHGFIGEAIERWQSWFDGLAAQLSDNDRPLFQQVVTFLQLSYQRQQRWQQAIVVVERALKEYQQSQAWLRVAKALRALADLSAQQGEEEAALDFESRILDDIPYDSLPPHFKGQQMVDIMLARLARGNSAECQKMLDQLRQTQEQGLAPMLDQVQSEIYLKDGEYEKAMPALAQQWMMVLEGQQPQAIEGFSARLKQIAESLGMDKFNEAFGQHLPPEAPRPF